MRLADISVLAGLVLFFLAAHFLLLVGILIRIVLTQWRRMLRTMSATHLKKTLRRSHNRSASRINDEETPYEANRMHLL
jgi:hypothetical protein